jgi:hypothetical protein
MIQQIARALTQVSLKEKEKKKKILRPIDRETEDDPQPLRSPEIPHQTTTLLAL